jgi:hypothetical protein
MFVAQVPIDPVELLSRGILVKLVQFWEEEVAKI